MLDARHPSGRSAPDPTPSIMNSVKCKTELTSELRLLRATLDVKPNQLRKGKPPSFRNKLTGWSGSFKRSKACAALKQLQP